VRQPLNPKRCAKPALRLMGYRRAAGSQHLDVGSASLRTNHPKIISAFVTSMQNAEQVYRQYRSKLLAFIQQRVRDQQMAEDVLHDVFVKIVGRKNCLREPVKITAWLYQVTRNATIDRLRSNRPHEELPQQIVANNEEPTAEARLASFLRPMIDTLPEIYRDTIIFSELNGMPLKQIAEREGITVSAVKSRVQRGRRMLEAMLRDCCAFEFSRDGAIMDFWPKSASSCRCSHSGNGSRVLASGTAAEEAQKPSSRVSH
jgi:RNA polymerase sigma-70 factor, ECF subfamily